MFTSRPEFLILIVLSLAVSGCSSPQVVDAPNLDTVLNKFNCSTFEVAFCGLRDGIFVIEGLRAAILDDGIHALRVQVPSASLHIIGLEMTGPLVIDFQGCNCFARIDNASIGGKFGILGTANGPGALQLHDVDIQPSASIGVAAGLRIQDGVSLHGSGVRISHVGAGTGSNGVLAMAKDGRDELMDGGRIELENWSVSGFRTGLALQPRSEEVRLRNGQIECLEQGIFQEWHGQSARVSLEHVMIRGCSIEPGGQISAAISTNTLELRLRNVTVAACDWAIWEYSHSDSVELEYVSVTGCGYAVSLPATNHLQIQHSRFEDLRHQGVAVTSNHISIENSSFRSIESKQHADYGGTGDAVRIASVGVPAEQVEDVHATATIRNSTFEDLEGWAVVQLSGAVIDARNNWWGDARGPTPWPGLEPGDDLFGEPVHVPWVQYAPWLQSAP